MVKIEFIEFDGTRHPVEAEAGHSLMQAAVTNLVPGIDATCGGDCMCGTCQCYVDAHWLAQLNPKTDAEISMLEHALNVQSNSRLACQVILKDELDGMIVRLPASQF
ncbi:MAG TPA: 2Fe-2S iron-sulfur cluster-binding protein [Pseudomonadales bacterium]|nr:2Fe-2S iron-sulfur cluster-binding protein [Pseudomonadales bacterium]